MVIKKSSSKKTTTKKKAIKKGSADVMAAKKIAIRNQFWPDVEEHMMWDRKKEETKGFLLPHHLGKNVI